MSKVKKVRTSITIDPNVLQRVRKIVEDPENDYKSVAQFIEISAREAADHHEALAGQVV